MRLTSRKARQGRAIELSMTSMIDVIFLLLIFFMLNVGFHQAERELESGLQGQSSGKSSTDLEPVIVEIVNTGGGYVFQLGNRSIDRAEELTRVLRLFARTSESAFVRVRDDSPFSMVAAAIQACHDAGFRGVTYVADTDAD
jgi:biopolymer transport protein ExbD